MFYLRGTITVITIYINIYGPGRNYYVLLSTHQLHRGGLLLSRDVYNVLEIKRRIPRAGLLYYNV